MAEDILEKYYIPNILESSSYQTADSKADHFLTQIRLTSADSQSIEKITADQRDCEEWHKLRKFRITASNFDAILTQMERDSFPPSFWKRILGSKDLSHVPAIKYGIDNERRALSKYEKITHVKTSRIGLCLDKNGFIGGSPDAFVDQDKILEIKCPFSLRFLSLPDALACPSFYIEVDEDGEFRLKKGSRYENQVQGQIYLAHAKSCDFFVWTPKWHILINIKRDDEWVHKFELLERFYKNTFLPKLLLNN